MRSRKRVGISSAIFCTVLTRMSVDVEHDLRAAREHLNYLLREKEELENLKVLFETAEGEKEGRNHLNEWPSVSRVLYLGFSHCLT